jgi:hypothetical protein
MSRTQWRANSEAPASIGGEERIAEGATAEASGKVHAGVAETGVRNWFDSVGKPGVAETGRDSGEGWAAQQLRPLQGQQAATEFAAPAAGAGAGTNSVSTSNRLQTMASAVFMIRILPGLP